ncbi:MAG: outer membrane protein assembly factor BamB family protein [Caulobacteraceae bacterium]
MHPANLAAAALAAILLPCAALAEDHDDAFNRRGDILIADQFNNRVIEINRAGEIVWHFGLGPNDVSAKSAVGTNDALRVGHRTLISGTGAPAGSEPLCPSGCADNRVFFVSRKGRITWQYGQFGVTGSGPDQLNTPVQATWTAAHTVFITDQGNQRVIEVSKKTKKILWQFGVTGVPGAGPDHLNNPNSVEVLDDGHLLIADENNNRAIEVDRKKKVLATFTIGGTASGVAFASRLPNGDTLITDSNNNRVVEVNAKDQPVWSYVTNTQKGSNANPLPTRAIRLKNGDTIISDQFNHRVIIVSHAGAIVRQYGNLNAPGYGVDDARQGLNAPYDAKVLGEDVGLTFFGPGDSD